jgi:AbrB family looped-hinge helix DNA binding protein
MKITTKGQVTIPQEFRRKYNLEASAEVEFLEEEGKIVLRVVKKADSPFKKLLGSGDVKLSTDEILALTRGD